MKKVIKGYMNDLNRIKQQAGLNEDSSDISLDALSYFVKDAAIAFEKRYAESLENMKSEMDPVFDDSGNSLVQTKRYLIDNAVAIIDDLRQAERQEQVV